MAHGPAQGVVHSGPTTMAGHRARWSLAMRPLWDMVARRMWHNGERGARRVHLGPHQGAGGSVAVGDGSEETVEEALGADSPWAEREEKESGVRCDGGQRGSPFI
jgi:hypothetical protein